MRRFSFASLVLIVFCIGFTKTVVAEPFVIFDSGYTVSTAPYKTIILDGQRESDFYSWFDRTLPGAIIDEENKKISELFPLTTEQLSPLHISSRQDIYLSTLPAPICIIGTDNLSFRWVRKNAVILKKVGAVCLLVSAPDVDKARLILNALNEVPMHLAHGDKLSDYFDFNHYPVLITERVISQ